MVRTQSQGAGSGMFLDVHVCACEGLKVKARTRQAFTSFGDIDTQ